MILRNYTEGLQESHIPRQVGSTTRIAEFVKGTNTVAIVWMDDNRKMLVKKGVDVKNIVTLKEVIKGKLRGDTRPMIVDPSVLAGMSITLCPLWKWMKCLVA